MNIKKIAKGVGIAAIGGTMLIAGCTDTTQFTQEDLDKALLQGKSEGMADGIEKGKEVGFEEGVASVEIPEVPEAPIDVPTVEPVVVLTGFNEEFYLGQDIDVSWDDSEIKKLLDDEVELNGENYDVEEYFVINNEARFSSGIDDKDFETDAYFTLTKRKALGYYFVFKDEIPYDEVNNEEELEIKFLGNDLTITNIADNEITIEKGTEISMYVGDTKAGVMLLGVGSSGSVMVSVDGEQGMVGSYRSKTINGIQIEVRDTFYDDITTERMATLLIGKDIKETIEDGDYYDDDEEWKYEISTDDDKLKHIALIYDKKHNDLDDEDYAPLAEGDSISLPHNYLTLTFSETNEPTYTSYEISYDSTYDYELTSDNDDGFVCGNDEYRRVYLEEGDFYDRNDVYIDCEVLELEDTEFVINGNLALWIGEHRHVKLLDLPETAYRDEALMDNYGVKYDNLEDWMEENGDLELEIPDERLEISLNVG